MFKKIFTIVVPVLAITAAILLFGIRVYNDSYSTFQEDGYVLGMSEKKDSGTYYFLKENKYKVNETKNEVTFINADDEEITIPNDAFVHYSDGSIATFKKAVVLNLGNVKNSTLQYYNVYEGSIFSKTSDGHQIDYLDQKLAFKDYIIKNAENKYMVVGKGLLVKYGEEEKLISDGFLEIEYLDGNIIKITNQDLNIQNISKDLTISSDGIIVDLLNKKIIYDGETKVNLGEITIDSDDNIEIIPDENNTLIEEDPSLSVEHFEDQPITTPNVNIGGMQSGVVDTSTKRPDEIVQENETVPDAEFDVENISVTPTSVDVDILVKEQVQVLVGDISWKIVENSTNRVVYSGTEAQNTRNFEISYNQLSPETNYSVIVRSAYVKNDVNYEKDFVQKTFVTKSMGVSVDKDYVTTNQVSFNVHINGYSGINAFYYDLSGPDGEIVQKTRYDIGYTVNNGDDLVIPLTFETIDGLYQIRSNSDYTLRIYGIQYDNLSMADKHKVTKTLKTMKIAPTPGTSAVAINKQGSQFVIYLNNVKDPDNGAINYRADIYQKNNVGGPETIVTSRSATTSSEIVIDVDEKVINRNVNYQANLYLTFHDNEMEYEIYLGFVDMLMNSVQGPSITFNEIAITHERIHGSVTIKDPNETIDLNKEMYIIFQNNSLGFSSETITKQIDQGTIPNKKSFTFEIDNNNLKSNSTYSYSIMAWADYKDENGYALMEIGQFMVTTAKPTPLVAAIDNLTEKTPGAQFKINFKLEASDSTTQGNNPLEMRTMNEIRFRIRSEDYDINTPCLPENKCWLESFQDQYTSDPYKSSIQDILFTETGYDFLPNDFDIMATDMPYGNYIFEVLGATDYTSYSNDLPIKEESKSIVFNPNATSDNVISNRVYTETPIYNNGAIVATKDSNLKSNTIIGYKIVPDATLPTDNRSEYTFTYKIHDLTTNTTKVIPWSEITPLFDASANDGNNAIAILFKDVADSGSFKFERGRSYAITYEVKFKDPATGKEIVAGGEDSPVPIIPFKTQPNREVPSFETYLSTTSSVDGTQTWKYKAKDVDSALVEDATRGISGVYSPALNPSWVPLTCGGAYIDCLKNAEGSFQTKIDQGELIVKTTAQLNDGATLKGIAPTVEEIKIVDEITYAPIITHASGINYKIIRGANDITYEFYDYRANVLSQNVANVKIELRAPSDGTTITVYKEFVKNGFENIGSGNQAQVSLDFSSINSLMGKGKIESTITFLYDRQIPGFEAEEISNSGYAIEENVNNVRTMQYYNSKYRIFPTVTFDPTTKALNYSDIEGNSYTKTLKYGSKGMYYTNASNQSVYVNLKPLTPYSVNCSGAAGAVCDFSFDSIQPTLYLEENEITPFIGGAKMQPSFVVDSSIENELKLIARYYELSADGLTCTNTQVGSAQEYSYKNEIKNNNDFWVRNESLGMGQGYCVRFKWKDNSGAEKDFFYGSEYNSNAANPLTREYKFQTLLKPIVSNFNVAYDIGTIRSDDPLYASAADSAKQHDSYNRSLTTTFQIDTIENYKGLTFELKDEEGNVLTGLAEKLGIQDIDVTTKTDNQIQFTFSVDASVNYTTLEANKEYYLSIIAYQSCSEGTAGCVSGKRKLEATDEVFLFYITEPTIKITRIENAADASGEFSIRLMITDEYRAVGGYSLLHNEPAEYSLSIVNDSGSPRELPLITTSSYQYVQDYYKIDYCKGSVNCTVYVRYSADLQNTGRKIDYSVSKDITVSTKVDIGTAQVVSSTTSGVTIGYTDSFGISSIKKIDYTLTNKATGKTTTTKGVTTTWKQDEENAYWTLNIKMGLVKGSYTLSVRYLDSKGKLVTSGTYDIIVA